MVDEQNGTAAKSPRHRSPAWPFISLGKAVERVRDFYKVNRDRDMGSSSANIAWGMGAKSGAGFQTIATLKQYGLMQESDTPGNIRLSEIALRIVRDQREVSSDRDAAIKQAALSPSIFGDIWSQWPDELPDDPAVEYYLVHDRGYSEDTAKTLLANYKSTIQFAKLTASDKLHDKEGAAIEHADDGQSSLAKPPVPSPSVGLMDGERIVFSHEIEPSHGVRILASGDMDDSVLDALDSCIELQKDRFGMLNESTLINSGFVHYPERRLWLNHDLRMAFSHQALRERHPQWLKDRLAEVIPDTDFVFHFNVVPGNIQICIDVLKEIGLPTLRPYVRLASLRVRSYNEP